MAAAAAVVIGLLGVGVVVAQIVTGQPGTEERLVTLLGAPDTAVADLEAPSGTTARFVFSETHNEGVLVAEGLEPASSGHAYALWVIEDETPALAGTFDTNEAGHTLTPVEAPDAAEVAVTVEAEPEPAGPTTDPLISGGL